MPIQLSLGFLMKPTPESGAYTVLLIFKDVRNRRANEKLVFILEVRITQAVIT